MDLYEKYHSNRKLEKRVISENDFTHKPLLKVLNSRLSNYAKMLDIGCGTGTMCFYFAARGIVTTGIDISKKAIKQAKLNARHLSLLNKTNFYTSNFPRKNIRGKFDLIVCSEVLEHIKDDGKAVSKIYSLLRKGGEALFSVPLKSSFLYRYKLLDEFEKKVGHCRRYSELEIINLVSKSKFKIIELEKNQGLLRDYLFTSTKSSFLVKVANRFKIISNIIAFLDEKLFFIGVSNIVILVKKK